MSGAAVLVGGAADRRVREVARHRGGVALECRAGAERLQAAAVGAGAGARRAVVLDDLVAELCAQARGAAVDPAVDDHAAAHARAEREHHEVTRRTAGHVLRLREGRAVGVVVHEDGRSDPRAQLPPELDTLERDVHAGENLAGGEVDLGGDSHAHGGRADAGLLDHLPDRGLDPRDDGVPGVHDGGVLDREADLAALHEPGRDLGPADVDSDHGGMSRGGHLRILVPRRPERNSPIT
jgi:hypothetical protein